LLFAILCTFCLTAALFLAIPIRSQTTPEYDPWKDITDDGYIGIDDIVSVAENFGALGDPTKNVNVTNWPLDEYGNLRIGTSTYSSTVIVCEGYTIELAESPKFICSAYVDGWKRGTVFIRTAYIDLDCYYIIKFMANNLRMTYDTISVQWPRSDTGVSFEIFDPYIEMLGYVLNGSDTVDITVVLYLQR